MIARGVVGGQVEDHLEAQPMRLSHQIRHVLHGAVLGLDGAEVADGIGRADALAPSHADRVGRHQVEHIGAEGADLREAAPHVGQR